MYSDEELIRCVQKELDHAVRELRARYNGALTNYCAGLLNSRDVGEEVAQETWIRVCRGLYGFNHLSSFETWLYKIANNCCNDALKQGWETRLNRALQESSALTPNPATEIAQRDHNRAVIAATEAKVATLDELCRAIYQRRYKDGITSWEELARTLGNPRNTLRYHHDKHLKQVFQEVEAEFPDR